MDLTPLYLFAALVQAVFFYGFVTIDHPPAKAVLQTGMFGVLSVVWYLSTIPH